MKRGFTLIEMLVVIGIIAILIGASIGGYSSMTRHAERAKCQELVSNVATALTAMFQDEGVWPKRLAAQGKTDGKLDETVSLAFINGTTKYLSLSSNSENTQLTGHDRFGVISPWAAAVVKRLGTGASKSSKVGSMTVDDHILHYALDLDGDGRILGASVGGQSVDIRATAAVWCGGKDGFVGPYQGGSGSSGKKGSAKSASGSSNDDVYSWTPGQTKNVQ